MTVERILVKQDWGRVASLLPSAGGATEPTALLREYCRRVIAWNRSVSNLISKNDEARIVERHVVESIEPAAWMAATGIADWLDFGSGAGFPAIPLAIAGVGTRWTLVESRRIKTLFLRKTLSVMAIPAEMSVVNARLEMIDDLSRPFLGFTARAAGKISSTLSMAAECIAAGGSAFLWKGSSWNEEKEQDRSWEAAWSFVDQKALTAENLIVLRFDKRHS